MAALATTPARADQQIREDVMFELKWDPEITSSDIAVAVQDGIVMRF
jgi:osmotically-inducible protein OsmY